MNVYVLLGVVLLLVSSAIAPRVEALADVESDVAQHMSAKVLERRPRRKSFAPHELCKIMTQEEMDKLEAELIEDSPNVIAWYRPLRSQT